MKLEHNSNVLLSITKSKAKMYEFGVDEEHHIKLSVEPNKLLRLTIGILGQFSALTCIYGGDRYSEEVNELKLQLVSVSQYFESLKESKLENDYEDYLLLLGASSYYLADMPGSSAVLVNKLNYDLDELTDNYIEGIMVWILKGDISKDYFYIEDGLFQEQITNFVLQYSSFFEQTGTEAELRTAIEVLRLAVRKSGSDRELFFVDVLACLAIKKIEISVIKCLPEYSGIELIAWQEVLGKKDFIREFWPAQRMLGEELVLKGKSSVIQMPTSVGKTKSTELIIRCGFLSGRASVAVIVAPFRSLVREITLSFENAFIDEDVNINELQDVPQVNQLELDMLSSIILDGDLSMPPSIIISTPEKLAYLLRHEPELANKIDLLIFDEGHQFDTGSRGVTYELLISSLKSKLKSEAQLILISAVLPNAETIADWLFGERGTIVKGGHCLPTLRSNAFVSWNGSLGQLQYVDKDLDFEKSYFVPRVISQVNLGTRGRETTDRLFPIKEDVSSISAYLGMKLSQQAPTAIFCGSKKSVVKICKMLSDMISRGLDIGSPLINSDENELSKISKLAKLHFGESSVIAESISNGILPHSANVPNGLRVSVEWAMANQKASLVICTSTLAQGVNLPIKYLIVSSTFQAGERISTRDFHNLMGRAGRSGFYTEGSIIFANPLIYDKRLVRNDSWRWHQAIELLDPSNTEACSSSLLELIKPLVLNYFDFDLMQVLAEPDKYIAIVESADIEQFEDISELVEQIKLKKVIMKSVESYIISQLADDEVMTHEFIGRLAKDTLAFHILSTEDEKNNFISAFEIALSNIQALSVEQIGYYRKCFLGISELKEIETWLDQNIEVLISTVSIYELFDRSWELLVKICTNKYFEKFSNLDIVKEAAHLWLKQVSYKDINKFLVDKGVVYLAGSQRRKIAIEHVTEFTDGALGYDSVLVYGALADICEGKYESLALVEQIHYLQSALKVGVSSKLGLWLYSKGYVDREVCKSLVELLTEEGEDADNFKYSILNKYKDNIQQHLTRFPSYFQNFDFAI